MMTGQKGPCHHFYVYCPFFMDLFKYVPWFFILNLISIFQITQKDTFTKSLTLLEQCIIVKIGI